MIDKKPDIKLFIPKHYSPSPLESSDLQLTSLGFLEVLFTVFPFECIDTYELYDILVSLGYTPQKKSSTEFVWCFKER